MKLLLTNDDGIDAPGLRALAEALAPLGQSLVVAPDRHLSGCGHQTTTDRPLELVEVGPARHALDGTPVDCVRVALAHLDSDIDWVFSGINEGGNLGADLYRSGTVAAVREAVLMGKQGIAVSQYRRRGTRADWLRAARWTAEVVELLLARPRMPGVFWNVNLPDAEGQTDRPEVVFCPLDPHPLPVRYRLDGGRLHYHASYHERAREVGHDVAVCFSGAIAITQVAMDVPRGDAGQMG